ncbi:site-specific integrase [Halapricum hydrolyticum]|uniref:Site-specific integrase n=1 Tax=Halapricum hydrolyticum TaxID=2979991 RepID=A0AAE3IC60_9EURY|nr:site-specific integrase [Halapricum hydrolyticum]MCU4718986.1 site-specific integrase [Halapricum hydrolyticum]MCU4727915.1 site-specific integrase [Halapricum hydrolyticum]
MRIEATNGTEHKVWLTDSELEQLRRHAGNPRNDLLIQLGGYVGLRAFEIPQIQPKHIKRTDDGEHYRLRVPEGKDTTGNGGKPRDAYLLESTERDLHQYRQANDLRPSDPFIDLSESGVRAVVKRVAERTAEATGEEDYQYVSSHDLRRRYAQRLLVDESMNPRVVMAVGGWDSWQAIEPYLNAPSEQVINDAFEGVSF